jgi:hypothetical protein
VCGDPALAADDDQRLMARIVDTALQALQTPVDRPTLFDPWAVQEASESLRVPA